MFDKAVKIEEKIWVDLYHSNPFKTLEVLKTPLGDKIRKFAEKNNKEIIVKILPVENGKMKTPIIDGGVIISSTDDADWFAVNEDETIWLCNKKML